MLSKKIHVIFLGLSFFHGLSSFAMQPVIKDKDGLPLPAPYSWVASLSVGPVWQDAGKTQTLYLTPTIVKTYAASKSTEAMADGELFLGVQKTLSGILSGQLGVAFAAAGNAKLNGYIWDDADPMFNNYSYHYKVTHTHIAAKAKLLADAGYPVIPWISGSIGVGFNDAHDFSNTPLIPEAITMPNFASNTKSSFTYTVGAGVQKALTSQVQIGIGYEFADWGKSRLDSAAGQTGGSGLVLNHLYTNGFLINLTYLA